MLQPLRRWLLFDAASPNPDAFKAFALDLMLECDVEEVQHEEKLVCRVLIALIEKMDGEWSERSTKMPSIPSKF